MDGYLDDFIEAYLLSQQNTGEKGSYNYGCQKIQVSLFNNCFDDCLSTESGIFPPALLANMLEDYLRKEADSIAYLKIELASFPAVKLLREN